MAFIEGHPEIWGCGERVSQAIRDVVLSHQIGCDIEVKYEVDYESLERYLQDIKSKIEQKKEERLKIGQEIICPKHGSQVIDAIDDSVPQRGALCIDLWMYASDRDERR